MEIIVAMTVVEYGGNNGYAVRDGGGGSGA